MSVVEDYLNLWFMGGDTHEPTHLVLDEANRKMKIKYADFLISEGTADSKRMAERILQDVEFDTRHLDNLLRGSGLMTSTVQAQHNRDIDYVHAKYSKEIRASWEPDQMSEQELDDALFTHAIQPELDKMKIPKDIDVNIGGEG